MNICTFSGRIVADATSRMTTNGTSVCTFRIAVDTGFGEHKRTDFINCVLWKRESLVPHLSKGKPVIISGEYQGREYEDRNGQKQRTVEIIVRELDFQQGQPNQGQASQQPSQQAPRQQKEEYESAFPSEASGMQDVPF